MPKGIFRDSGLNNYMQGLSSFDKLNNSPLVGQNFESFIIEEIIRGVQASQAVRWDYSYYRTKAGSEVDLILSGEFGLLPIEIKYAQTVPSNQLRALKDFIKDQNCRFGLVINNDECPRLYDEQIAGIPLACL